MTARRSAPLPLVGRGLVLALLLAGAGLGWWHAELEPAVEHSAALPHVSTGHADRQARVHLDAAEAWSDHHCATCAQVVPCPSPAPGAWMAAPTPGHQAAASVVGVAPGSAATRLPDLRGPPSLLA